MANNERKARIGNCYYPKKISGNTYFIFLVFILYDYKELYHYCKSETAKEK